MLPGVFVILAVGGTPANSGLGGTLERHYSPYVREGQVAYEKDYMPVLQVVVSEGGFDRDQGDQHGYGCVEERCLCLGN